MPERDEQPSLNDKIEHSKSWLNPEQGVPSTDGFVWGGVSWSPVSGDYVSRKLKKGRGPVKRHPDF